jgi:N-methylhydantoinase B/oxoprolinase/acetone carboxylase alpha subunit
MVALQLTKHLYAVPATQVAIELLCCMVLTQCDIVFVRSLLCRRDGSATFDFTGTGPEVYGNLNAPPAVAYSAIIYSLRCLVTRDIPLNQGCLAPIKVRAARCVGLWAVIKESWGANWVGGAATRLCHA